MTKEALVGQIFEKKSFLCIGLDTDLNRIPTHLLQLDDPIYEFNKAIIDATHDLCVAYKPNIAFYESLGAKGWQSLEKTLHYIPKNIFTIADAKRGDIGNTSRMYAKTFFDQMPFDSVTVAPYMGEDSVAPFLEHQEKWVILLALTSNKGSLDFQMTMQENNKPLYHKVMEKAMQWGSSEQLMFVIGATHPERFAEIRKIAPDHFFLVPGVGAQGGDLASIAKFGMNDQVGLLVNSSRGIIYAGSGKDFATEARNAAKKLQSQMADILVEKI